MGKTKDDIYGFTKPRKKGKLLKRALKQPELKDSSEVENRSKKPFTPPNKK